MAAAISSVGELVRVIQTKLATGPDGQMAKAAPAARGARGARAGTAYAPGKLEALIEMRVKKLGPDDPQRGRKAFRVFLEAVLLSHFGEHLINDAKFYQLVDDVQGAMEADPQCQQLVGRAVEQLLSKG